MSPNVDMSLFVDSSCLAEAAVASANRIVPPLFAAVTVDLDKTVFLQMALFAVLILLLKPLLFDPMLRVFALREERTEGARGEARQMQEKAAEILTNYEAEVAKVRADATAQRDQLRKETAQLEAKILAEGRAAADAITQEGRARIAQEISSLEADLAQRSQSVAVAISTQVLGREVSA